MSNAEIKTRGEKMESAGHMTRIVRRSYGCASIDRRAKPRFSFCVTYMHK